MALPCVGLAVISYLLGATPARGGSRVTLVVPPAAIATSETEGVAWIEALGYGKLHEWQGGRRGQQRGQGAITVYWEGQSHMTFCRAGGDAKLSFSLALME